MPIKFVELFHQLEDLMTPLGNFKYYRQLLAESKDKKPIVPYLVVFLRYFPSESLPPPNPNPPTPQPPNPPTQKKRG